MTDEAKPDKPEKPKIPNRTENWAEDQQQRSYYYDDACGYETYEPDGEEDEDEDIEIDPSA
jgi:hypothetical protein